MRIAYADPPYPGEAKRRYQCEEVDHVKLIQRLVYEFPDGWALSTKTPSLRFLLPLCPEEARVSAWVKPFAIFKPNVNPAYAWEPVIWMGGRGKRDRKEPTVRDWVSCNITLRRGLVGAKPEGFCMWLFNLMGMGPGDELVDLFPGTGAVTKAWEKFTGAEVTG